MAFKRFERFICNAVLCMHGLFVLGIAWRAGIDFNSALNSASDNGFTFIGFYVAPPSEVMYCGWFVVPGSDLTIGVIVPISLPSILDKFMSAYFAISDLSQGIF